MVGVQAGQERSKNGWSDTSWFVCIFLASHIWSAEGLDGDELSMHDLHTHLFLLDAILLHPFLLFQLIEPSLCSFLSTPSPGPRKPTLELIWALLDAAT